MFKELPYRSDAYDECDDRDEDCCISRTALRRCIVRNTVGRCECAVFARKEDVEVRGASAVAQLSFEVVRGERERGEIVRNIRRLFGMQLYRCLAAVERCVKKSRVESVQSPRNCTLIRTSYLIARSSNGRHTPHFRDLRDRVLRVRVAVDGE